MKGKKWSTKSEINFINNFCKDDPTKILQYKTSMLTRVKWDDIDRYAIERYVENRISDLTT